MTEDLLAVGAGFRTHVAGDHVGPNTPNLGNDDATTTTDTEPEIAATTNWASQLANQTNLDVEDLVRATVEKIQSKGDAETSRLREAIHAAMDLHDQALTSRK